MSKTANYALRLPRSIKEGAARLASRDGISLNQFIATAVAEKLAVMETVDSLEERAKRADMEKFWAILSREGEPPSRGDELPEGYIPVSRRAAR